MRAEKTFIPEEGPHGVEQKFVDATEPAEGGGDRFYAVTMEPGREEIRYELANGSQFGVVESEQEAVRIGYATPSGERMTTATFSVSFSDEEGKLSFIPDRRIPSSVSVSPHNDAASEPVFVESMRERFAERVKKYHDVDQSEST